MSKQSHSPTARLGDMPKHWRKWYLLFRMRGMILDESESAREEQIGDNTVFVGFNHFLKQVADKRLFLLPRSSGSKKRRMASDRAIVDECIASDPQLIEKVSQAELARRSGVYTGIVTDNDRGWLTLTGKGDLASSFTNSLEEFMTKFPRVWGLVLLIAAFSWWPGLLSHLYTTLCSYLSMLPGCF